MKESRPPPLLPLGYNAHACLEISSAKFREAYSPAPRTSRSTSPARLRFLRAFKLARPPHVLAAAAPFLLLSLPVSSLSRPSRYSDALPSKPPAPPRRPAGCLLEHELPSNELSSPFA